MNLKQIIKAEKNKILQRTFETHIKQTSLPEPEQEYKFHPKRKWKFDFAWPEKMVAVELNGGTGFVWRTNPQTGEKYKARGRHTEKEGYKQDCIKRNNAQMLGWKVYDFTSDMVLNGEAINFIEKIVN